MKLKLSFGHSEDTELLPSPQEFSHVFSGRVLGFEEGVSLISWEDSLFSGSNDCSVIFNSFNSI